MAENEVREQMILDDDGQAEPLVDRDMDKNDMGNEEELDMTRLPAIELIPVRWDVCEQDEPGIHGIPRDWREDMFYRVLEKLGINNYGYVEDEDSWLSEYVLDGDCGDGLGPHYEIRTPLFILRPFYWGDDRGIYELANFEWLPWHLEIRWYKWALRDASSNFAMTDDDWREICSKMLAWAEAMQTGQDFDMPPEEDHRSEADIWSQIWSRRIQHANDTADDHWLALTRLLDALSGAMLDEEEDPAKVLNDAIDQAVNNVEWGMFADEVDKSMELVEAPIVDREEDGDMTMTIKIRTHFTR